MNKRRGTGTGIMNTREGEQELERGGTGTGEMGIMNMREGDLRFYVNTHYMRTGDKLAQ